MCIAALLAFVSAASSVRAQETSERPLKVLPLGDSITAGIVAGGRPGIGGYRAPLERLLAGHARKVILVGDRHDYSPGMLAPWHDGWPGYVIRETSPGAPGQLYGGLVRRAIQTTQPDVILLMVGTNDFLRYEATHGTYSVDEIVRSMDLLLSEIYDEAPHLRVILGAIVNSPKVDACYIERFNTGHDACDTQTHPSLAGLAKAYAAKGYAITFASEMMGAVPRDRIHFPDGIHPANGPEGYEAIAQTWYRAISETIALDQVKTSASRPDSRAQDSSMAMRSPTDTSRPHR